MSRKALNSQEPVTLRKRRGIYVNRAIFEDILLVCDLDGTLLNSKRSVSQENKEALEYFVENGGKFTIATGRMTTGVEGFLCDLAINLPAILFNGAIIYDFRAKKVLWQSCLEKSMKKVVLQVEKRFPGIGIEIFNVNGLSLYKNNEEVEEHRRREPFSNELVNLDDIPWPWFKIILVWTPDKLREADEFLQELKAPFRTVNSEPEFIELLGANTSKGHALEKLVDITGYSTANVIAIGDNMNDMELIVKAGTGIAVENAHEDLKKIADFCCCHNDEHVIPYVVKIIEERKIKAAGFL